jgi:hypothetical protein
MPSRQSTATESPPWQGKLVTAHATEFNSEIRLAADLEFG